MTLLRCTLFSSLFLLLLLAGCADDPPNAVGLGLLPGRDSLRITALTAQAVTSTSGRTRIAGSSVNLLLGRSQGIESRLMLRFSMGSADFPNARIDSAVLKIRPRYIFNDSTALLDFTIQPVASLTWTAASFLWDSITTGFIRDTVAARVSSTISRRDTVVSIRLDTAIVRRWIAEGMKSFILLPSASMRGIVGFENYTSLAGHFPSFTVAYHDSLDSAKTIIGGLQASSFVANADLPAGDRILLQSAVSYRGRIVFDVSAIPAQATITDARLSVHIDPAVSLFTIPRRDSLFAHINLAENRDSLGFSALGVATDSTRSTIGFQVNSIVQQWVSGRMRNYGLVLRNFSEFAGAERIALYGASADSLLRPTLTIRYTLLP